MHELGVAQEIIRIAELYLPVDSNPVKSVRVKIGKLSNILVDSLIFGYEALIRDTRLVNSKLIIDEIPLTIKCERCGAVSNVGDFIFTCPDCGSNKIEVAGGTELQVTEIELED